MDEATMGGWTPLMAVCDDNFHVFAARLLLKHPQLKLNLVSKDGYTALSQLRVFTILR